MTDEKRPDEQLEAQAPKPPLPPSPIPDPPPAVPLEPSSASSEKSPALAMILAFVPFGLGHLYLGLYHRALVFFVAFWFSIYLELPLIAVFFYFFSIFDAFRQGQLLAHAESNDEVAAQPGKGGLTLGVFLVVVGGVLLLRKWIDLDEIRYFLQDYSPAILVAVGIYLIFAAIKERNSERQQLDSGDEY